MFLILKKKYTNAKEKVVYDILAYSPPNLIFFFLKFSFEKINDILKVSHLLLYKVKFYRINR